MYQLNQNGFRKMNDCLWSSDRPLGSKLAGASKNQCLEALSSAGQSVVPSLLLNLSLLSPKPLLCCLYWVCHNKKKTLSPKTKQSIRVWWCYLWTWKMTFLLFIVMSRLAFTTLSRFSFYKREKHCEIYYTKTKLNRRKIEVSILKDHSFGVLLRTSLPIWLKPTLSIERSFL